MPHSIHGTGYRTDIAVIFRLDENERELNQGIEKGKGLNGLMQLCFSYFETGYVTIINRSLTFKNKAI